MTGISKWTYVMACMASFTEAGITTYGPGAIVDLGYAVHQATVMNDTNQLFNFSNIRYAAPPLGDLGFSAPVPPKDRNSTLNHGQVGAICPQASPAWELVAEAIRQGDNASTAAAKYAASKTQIDPSILPPPGPAESEDCLLLDVIVPQDIFNRPGTKARRRGIQSQRSTYAGAPVLVWIDGGGYVGGSKSNFNPSGLLDASQLNSTQGMIFVTMNYRLGLYGFLSGPTFQQDGTGNAGLWDQRLALQWVQQYIHLFGGDPDRITVMGESAGGGSILHQITAFGGAGSDAAGTTYGGTGNTYGGTSRTLFKQAIPQSPAFLPIPSAEQTERVYQKVLDYATQVSKTNITNLSQLRALDFLTLYKVNALVVAKAPYSSLTFGPTVDGVFIPNLPGKLLLEGRFNHDVKLMIGHNSNESFFFTPNFETTTSQFNNFTRSYLPSAASTSVTDYIENTLYPPVFGGTCPYRNGFQRLQLFIAESTFTCNTRYLARGFGNNTYSYEFAVPPGLHGQDVPYTFYVPGTKPPFGGVLPMLPNIAKLLQTYIANFVTTGDPNGVGLPEFPTYGGDSTVLVLDAAADGKVMTDELASGRCEWWQQAYYG